MLNPIMTKAAGQPKMVAIIGCHKKGKQSNAVINPQGSTYRLIMDSAACNVVGLYRYHNRPSGALAL